MSAPSQQDLKQSIEELTAYRNRLHNEVEMISKKLKMPQSKIASTLNNHIELNNLENIITALKQQLET